MADISLHALEMADVNQKISNVIEIPDEIFLDGTESSIQETSPEQIPKKPKRTSRTSSHTKNDLINN